MIAIHLIDELAENFITDLLSVQKEEHLSTAHEMDLDNSLKDLLYEFFEYNMGNPNAKT